MRPVLLQTSPSSETTCTAHFQIYLYVSTKTISYKKSRDNYSVSPSRTILLLGWTLFAYLSYQTAQNDVVVEAFNPYAILQLSEGSSEDSIKKAYRKLTLIYHPDKETGSEQKFMELTEAYRVKQLKKCTKTYNDNVHF